MKINFGNGSFESAAPVTVYDAAKEAGVISRDVIAAVVNGAKILLKALSLRHADIAVTDNKMDAVRRLDKMLKGSELFDVTVLKTKYPQGDERQLILAITKQELPAGKLPADVGCIVMNVASVAFVARYIKTGKPLVSRSLTVAGSAIAEPKNIRVPLGTNIGEIIEFCGGFKEEPHKIITGGPMMGLSIVGTDLPVIKNNNAILAFTKKDAQILKESDCIRCGRCAAACPMSLMPTLIERYTKAGNAQALEKAGIMVCMECGSCAYSCPAKKPLVQSMRAAKAFLREAGAAK